MSENQTVERSVAAQVSVDVSPDGREVRVIYTDEDLQSLVLLFTPENAAKLGQQLINVANRMQR